MGQSHLKIGRGDLRGRVIRFSEEEDLRPTLSRVREAVFSMIADYSQSHGFIDLCAGSGIMGFQACSMDFHPVVLLDTHPPVIDQLQKNAAALDVDLTISRTSAMQLERLKLPGRPYLLYGDPPFRAPKFHEKMLLKLANWPFIESGSLYLAEQEDPETPAVPDGFELVKQKRYGRISILVFRKL